MTDAEPLEAWARRGPARWACGRFTGIFTAIDDIAPEPHDPAVALTAGTVALRGPQRAALVIGGAGWTRGAARMACLGEALERFECWARPSDRPLTARRDRWPLDEPALDPAIFVGFSESQREAAELPFSPVDDATELPWLPFRRVLDGEPTWAPAELASLHSADAAPHALAPVTSTGLSAGPLGHPVVLRGLQEVVERDAVVRGWWGEYPVREIPGAAAWRLIGARLRASASRPHLRYRFFHVESPYSAHVTMALADGEEDVGPVLSTGSACRETRAESLRKSLLEAIQGRHYVRHQLREARGVEVEEPAHPRDFREHVLWYSSRPERLEETVLARGRASAGALDAHDASEPDTLEAMARRLPAAPLVRLVTPPSLLGVAPGWRVVKVLAPGLVPLHGDHRLAHLGAAAWRDRPYEEWLAYPPHPFA